MFFTSEKYRFWPKFLSKVEWVLSKCPGEHVLPWRLYYDSSLTKGCTQRALKLEHIDFTVTQWGVSGAGGFTIWDLQFTMSTAGFKGFQDVSVVSESGQKNPITPRDHGLRRPRFPEVPWACRGHRERCAIGIRTEKLAIVMLKLGYYDTVL